MILQLALEATGVVGAGVEGVGGGVDATGSEEVFWLEVATGCDRFCQSFGPKKTAPAISNPKVMMLVIKGVMSTGSDERRC